MMLTTIRKSSAAIHFALLLMPFWCGSIAHAQTWSNLSGKVENSVRSYLETKTEKESNEFIQNYIIGLRGQLFSPRFMTYYIGTRLDDRNRLGSRTQQVYWYDASAMLFRGRPVSVQLHSQRSELNLIGSSRPARYEDDNGAELFYFRPEMPRVRVGYRNIAQTGLASGDVNTHLTTLRVENSFRDARISATFRDEQRLVDGPGNSVRNQETHLIGTAMPFENTQVSTDLQLSRRDNYNIVRGIFQATGKYRDHDRLNSQVAISRYVSGRQQTMTREFRGDYRRYLNSHLHLATLVNSHHITSESPMAKESQTNDDFGLGMVYSRQSSIARGRRRINGQVFGHYYETPLYGRGSVASHRLSAEQQRPLNRWISILGRIDQIGRLENLSETDRSRLSHELMFEGTVQPSSTVALISRSRLVDTQGFDRIQRFEQREELFISPSVKLYGSSTFIWDRILTPFIEETIHWTNRISWLITRHITLNAQSAWVLNQSTGAESFWMENTAVYRYRKMEFQLTFRQDVYAGQDKISVYLRGARIIGDGVAKR
jgi:hypothetical protein